MSHLCRLLAPLDVASLGADPALERQERPQVGLARDPTLPQLYSKPPLELLVEGQLLLVVGLLLSKPRQRALLGQVPVSRVGERIHRDLVRDVENSSPATTYL